MQTMKIRLVGQPESGLALPGGQNGYVGQVAEVPVSFGVHAIQREKAEQVPDDTPADIVAVLAAKPSVPELTVRMLKTKAIGGEKHASAGDVLPLPRGQALSFIANGWAVEVDASELEASGAGVVEHQAVETEDRDPAPRGRRKKDE